MKNLILSQIMKDAVQTAEASAAVTETLFEL